MTIEVTDLPGRLQELIEAVRNGSEVILRDGDATASLTIPLPMRNPNEPRIPNLHPGNAWMADDFNDPLPDDLWDGPVEPREWKVGLHPGRMIMSDDFNDPLPAEM